MISTANLTIQYGVKPLFESVSIKFGEGNRYGLIGANGSGKSTFMQILGGARQATSGLVTITPGEQMAMLGQDQFAFEQHTAIDTVILGDSKLWAVKQAREQIYSQPEMSDEDGIEVAELEVSFAEMDGYTAESRAGELLLGVGIPLDRHFGPMSEVAPGDKLRVLLAQALFSDPEIMLLDEPTNNLDINTIRWLENTLNARNSTMIIISHDRHFLNSVCTHMADLDYGEIRVYPGNYDDFMLASTQARQRKLGSNARKQAQVKELQAFIARFKANKSKARQATSRQKQIEKLQVEKIVPSSRQNPFIRFAVEKKLHRNVLETKKLNAGYGDEKVITDLDMIVEAGEKIAIIGPNGAGKTTLLNALLDHSSVSRSGAVKWAENADTGYFEQDHSRIFTERVSLFDWITRWTKPGDDEQVVRGVLGRLLFSRDDIGKTIDVLSGGEQGRLLFGKLMLGRHNVMLLDEPTNHLDMESIESLNMALELYPGTLIFVSHDREFVASLATRIIELTADGVIDYKGNYDDYLRSRGLN